MKAKSIRTFALLAILAAAFASCATAPDPSWPPSPPPSVRPHVPWGDNWQRDGRF